MRALIRTVVSGLLVLLSSIAPSRADLLGTLGGATINQAINQLTQSGAMLIQKLLDGFDATSHSLLQQGAHDGNVLLIQGGNQMQLVVASARAQFGTELQNRVSQASAELKPFLIELERFQLSIGKLKKNAVDLEDLFALDLQDLPFSKSYFGIRRVLGTILVQNGEDSYPIVLRGLHFGMAAAGETIKFDVKLDGNPLGEPKIGDSPDDAIFYVPASIIKEKFNDNTLVILKLDVEINRISSRLGGFLNNNPELIKHSFDVSLMPDHAGNLQITITRPVYKWKAVLNPETKRQTVTGPYTFSYSVANPNVVGAPNPGEQTISDTVNSTCAEDMRPARQFPNNRVEFADNPIFKNGWDTPKYIGADPRDWDVATQQVFDTWGIRWSTWGNNACGPINSGRHCHVPKEVLLDNSTPTKKDATGCHQTSLEAPKWTNNHTAVSVDVVGGTPAAPAPWTVVFQALSYVQDGIRSDPVITVPVLASKPTIIDISKPQGITGDVAFIPNVGKPKYGTLGKDITPGLQIMDQPVIGVDIQRFRYSFHYPTFQ